MVSRYDGNIIFIKLCIQSARSSCVIEWHFVGVPSCKRTRALRNVIGGGEPEGYGSRVLFCRDSKDEEKVVGSFEPELQKSSSWICPKSMPTSASYKSSRKAIPVAHKRVERIKRVSVECLVGW